MKWNQRWNRLSESVVELRLVWCRYKYNNCDSTTYLVRLFEWSKRVVLSKSMLRWNTLLMLFFFLNFPINKLMPLNLLNDLKLAFREIAIIIFSCRKMHLHVLRIFSSTPESVFAVIVPFEKSHYLSRSSEFVTLQWMEKNQLCSHRIKLS